MADSVEIQVIIGDRRMDDRGDVEWLDAVWHKALVTATTKLGPDHAKECQRRLGEILKRLIDNG